MVPEVAAQSLRANKHMQRIIMPIGRTLEDFRPPG